MANGRVGPEDWGSLPEGMLAAAERDLADPTREFGTVEVKEFRPAGRGATVVVEVPRVVATRRLSRLEELRNNREVSVRT